MRFITAVTLFIGFFNALFAAHVFVVLYIFGEYPIREPVKWIAAFEVVLCLFIAGLFMERLFRLKEKR